MRSSVLLLLMSSVAVLATRMAMAEGTSHRVSVCMQSFSAISVQSGDVPLTMNDHLGEPRPAIDGARCRLRWMTNQEGQRITVVSSLASPKIPLTVEALNVTGGTAVGEVTLSAAPQGLVIGLSRGVGGCDLRYTARVTELPPPGRDVHLLTYTITDGQ